MPKPSETTITSPSPALVEQLGQLEQQLRVVLHGHRARVQKPWPRRQAVLARPFVVARPQRQLIEHRPIVHHVNPRPVDSPVFKQWPEVFGDQNEPSLLRAVLRSSQRK